MQKIRFKFIYVPIMLMLLGGALMIGLTDYIAAGFTIGILSNPEFWTNVACTNIGIACIIIAILLIRIDNFKESDPNYLITKKYIFDYYNNKDYQTSLFRKFSSIENRELKKEAYKNKIHKKFTKLKAKPKDLQIKQYGTDEEKEKNKYCVKYQYYETLLTDKYVEETIDKLRIKHNTITESLVFSGVSTNSYTTEYITKHKAAKAFRDLIPKYLLTFSITVIVAALTLDLKDGITWVTIFKTATKAFSICSQIYYAYNYANKYNDEVTMHDINYRQSIIKKYDLWLASKIKEVKE